MLMLWVLTITAFASSFATPESRPSLYLVTPIPRPCEPELSGEFERVPNDTEYGLVTASVELTAPNLLAAYERGIFPWGQSGETTAEWYSPPWRGILELNNIHIGRSDRKFLRRHLSSGEYKITFDTAFEEVIKACAAQTRWTFDKETGFKRPAQPWLTPLFIQRYVDLHKAGHAHSVEVWRRGKLVAGLYGVFVKGMFSGESMFHDREQGKDAAKLALWALTERLKEQGHQLIDTQMVVEGGLTEKWGARYITRQDYKRRLREAQEKLLPF